MRMYDYVIEDPSGIHAYPATAIAGCFDKHKSMVQIEYKDQIIDGSDVLAIMSLYAKEGDTLSFYISGEDEDATMEDLLEVLKKLKKSSHNF